MLYKASDQIKTKVDVAQIDGKVHLMFSCNGGKHDTDEILDSYEIEPIDLLETLQASAVEDDTDNAPLQNVSKATAEQLREFSNYLVNDWNCPDIDDSIIDEYLLP